MLAQVWRAELASFVRCGRRRFLSVPRRRRHDTRRAGAGDAAVGRPLDCGAPGAVFQGASDEVRFARGGVRRRGARSDGARRARRAAAHAEEARRLDTTRYHFFIRDISSRDTYLYD